MIINAEALRLPLADASVDACLTSPPYWGGLRVYAGHQARDWPAISYAPMPGLPPVEIPAQAVALGHEPDPFAFVGHLLLIFREVRRVLKPGACLAVNLGDCYSSGHSGPSSSASTLGGGKSPYLMETGAGNRQSGIPQKNLILMPWRFALAMQADGWILRSRMPGGAEVMPWDDVGIEPDIVWRKKSCMPESVRDRPTVDFEDVLIFSQSPRYFWDQEAGREANERPARAPNEPRETNFKKAGAVGRHCRGGGPRNDNPAGRNMRSVWTINPEPTDEEHFAAWPVALASRLIRVMTSERGACRDCGAPWFRRVDRPAGAAYWASRKAKGEGMRHGTEPQGLLDRGKIGGAQWGLFQKLFPPKDLGWSSACACGSDFAPAIVLDPFAGLGRTWEAAVATGRRFVGADLGLGYCRLARARNDVEAMGRRKSTARAKTISGPLFEI